MDLRQMVPLVIYDDRCYLCIKFAGMVNALAGRKVKIVGHYSKTGGDLREKVLDSSALEMFWFVDGETAFGGRAALWPLVKTMLFAKKTHRKGVSANETCGAECKSIKAVFLRSASLLARSKTIRIGRQV